MRILQICNKVPYPPSDGGAIGILNFTKGFADIGHKVTVFAMNTNKHYCDINCVPKELKTKINFIIIDVPAKITAYGAFINLLFSKLPYNAERFIDDNFKEQLTNHLKKNDYDVIQLEGLYLYPYEKIARKYSKALISLRSHNVEYEIWDRVSKQEGSFIKRKYLEILTKRLKRFEKESLNNYDVLVPVTKRDNKKLDEMGNIKPSLVIQTGVYLNHIKPDTSEVEYPSVFHIGALDWAPNQEGLKWFFENVWKQVVELLPNIKIYIAGRNAPQSMILYLKKQPNLIFLGEIDDAYKFMNKKAIMIVPLLSGSGLRVKIIEGMSLGKTIVSTTIGTEGLETTNNNNIIITDEASIFAKSIINLSNNKQLYNEIGTRAIEFSNNNFNIIEICKKQTAFFEKNISTILQ